MWDGGVRGVAIVHSALLHRSGPGTFTPLFHASDWHPTVVFGMAGVTPREIDRGENGCAVPALDGVDQWTAIRTNATDAANNKGPPDPSAAIDAVGPRKEVLIQWDPLAVSFNGVRGDGPKSAIRIGEMKLLLGPPGCPDAILAPYGLDGTSLAPEHQTGPSPSSRCQAEMDAWCNFNKRTNCQRPYHNATRCEAHCGAEQS